MENKMMPEDWIKLTCHEFEDFKWTEYFQNGPIYANKPYPIDVDKSFADPENLLNRHKQQIKQDS